jgi:hypothetical protein
MYVDFNPFLFQNEVEGALIRLSTSTLLNVSLGGGQTALLVLEDFCSDKGGNDSPPVINVNTQP